MEDLSIEHPDLAEYFDDPAGELPDHVTRHLAGCSSCAEELAALTALRLRARRLPREVEPPRDLWQGISRRIDPLVVAGPTAEPARSVRPLRLRRFAGMRREWLAAAAIILVLITAGSTTLLLRGAAGGRNPVAAAPTGAAEAPGLVAFASSASEYASAVEGLEAELEARRQELSPETIAIVEQNLAIIDGAIEESRRALMADPTSADLPLLLAAVYRQKVELLRQAVQLSPRS